METKIILDGIFSKSELEKICETLNIENPEAFEREYLFLERMEG